MGATLLAGAASLAAQPPKDIGHVVGCHLGQHRDGPLIVQLPDHLNLALGEEQLENVGGHPVMRVMQP